MSRKDRAPKTPSEGFDDLLADERSGAESGALVVHGTPADQEPTAVLVMDEDDEAPTSRVKGWGRVFRGNRLLWSMAATAVVCLVLGLLAGRFILSPADAAANAEVPDPGLVTAPVEFGELTNDVTIRADVGYTNPLEVTLDTSTLSGAAVVTGQVPAVGDTLEPLSVAMEIAGRPVIVLPGELPAYRTLRIGVSGPDVIQLREALTAVGIPAGDVASNVFDQALADAVGQLYVAAGYQAPAGDAETTAMYTAAQESVSAAEQGVATAEAALAAAQAGPDPVEAQAAENAVNAAQRALDNAAEGEDRASLREALQMAKLQRDQLWAARDTSAEQAGVTSAYDSLERARNDLEVARQGIQPYLPSSEVLYLLDLPRRVDDVQTARGQVLQGVAMTVSGATVELAGAAAAADAKLLTVGGAATFELPDGTEHTASISEIEEGKGTDRWNITLLPATLTAEQIQALQGSNVRVSIPIGATEGEVLSVPLSALTAGPGGESRVEVVDSDPREGDKAETRLVVVQTGLSAGGFVEITPTEGEIEAGDLVVIGE